MNNEGLLYFIGWMNLIQGKATLGESTFEWNDSSSHNLVNMSFGQDRGGLKNFNLNLILICNMYIVWVT